MDNKKITPARETAQAMIVQYDWETHDAWRKAKENIEAANSGAMKGFWGIVALWIEIYGKCRQIQFEIEQEQLEEGEDNAT